EARRGEPQQERAAEEHGGLSAGVVLRHVEGLREVALLDRVGEALDRVGRAARGARQRLVPSLELGGHVAERVRDRADLLSRRPLVAVEQSLRPRDGHVLRRAAELARGLLRRLAEAGALSSTTASGRLVPGLHAMSSSLRGGGSARDMPARGACAATRESAGGPRTTASTIRR